MEINGDVKGWVFLFLTALGWHPVKRQSSPSEELLDMLREKTMLLYDVSLLWLRKSWLCLNNWKAQHDGISFSFLLLLTRLLTYVWYKLRKIKPPASHRKYIKCPMVFLSTQIVLSDDNLHCRSRASISFIAVNNYMEKNIFKKEGFVFVSVSRRFQPIKAGTCGITYHILTYDLSYLDRSKDS